MPVVLSSLVQLVYMYINNYVYLCLSTSMCMYVLSYTLIPMYLYGLNCVWYPVWFSWILKYMNNKVYTCISTCICMYVFMFIHIPIHLHAILPLYRSCMLVSIWLELIVYTYWWYVLIIHLWRHRVMYRQHSRSTWTF